MTFALVARRLRERGYDVAAVNPHAASVDRDPCWPDLASAPGAAEAVVIGTSSAHAEATVMTAVLTLTRRCPGTSRASRCGQAAGGG